MNAFQALNRGSPLRCFVFAFVILFLLFIAASWRKEVLWSACRVTFDGSVHSDSLAALSAIPQRRRNVAFATTFVYHLDVLLPVAWTMERVMKGNGNMQAYLPASLPYDFQDVVDELGLYRGAKKEYSQFIDDLRANSEIDLVILATCEFESVAIRVQPYGLSLMFPCSMRDWGDALLTIWDARSAEHKFQLVCIVHHAEDTVWQGRITEWSRRRAFRVLAISDQYVLADTSVVHFFTLNKWNSVAKAFKRKFEDHATDPDPVFYSAGYEYIPADFHSPIFNFTNLPEMPPTRTLTHAVIQGSYDTDRRDYNHIFEQLLQSLHGITPLSIFDLFLTSFMFAFTENPKPWGYLSPRNNNSAYIEDVNADQPPFKLYLAGSGGGLDVPHQLQNVVVFRRDLSYPEFYKFLEGMDICLPAFSRGNEYYEQQASSTVATCSQLNVSILSKTPPCTTLE
jgi:hypothetical protein